VANKTGMLMTVENHPNTGGNVSSILVGVSMIVNARGSNSGYCPKEESMSDLKQEFEPFGLEWENDVKKHSKASLIAMLKGAFQGRLKIKVELESKLEAVTKEKNEAVFRVLVLEGCEGLMQSEVDDAKSELQSLRETIAESPKVWVARDKDGYLCSYSERPGRFQGEWGSDGIDGLIGQIADNWFPDLKWEDEPIEVSLVREVK